MTVASPPESADSSSFSTTSSGSLVVGLAAKLVTALGAKRAHLKTPPPSLQSLDSDLIDTPAPPRSVHDSSLAFRRTSFPNTPVRDSVLGKPLTPLASAHLIFTAAPRLPLELPPPAAERSPRRADDSMEQGAPPALPPARQRPQAALPLPPIGPQPTPFTSTATARLPVRSFSGLRAPAFLLSPPDDSTSRGLVQQPPPGAPPVVRPRRRVLISPAVDFDRTEMRHGNDSFNSAYLLANTDRPREWSRPQEERPQFRDPVASSSRGSFLYRESSMPVLFHRGDVAPHAELTSASLTRTSSDVWLFNTASMTADQMSSVQTTLGAKLRELQAKLEHRSQC